MPRKLTHCFDKWSPTTHHKKYRLNPKILIFKIVEVLSCKEFTSYASQPIQTESCWIWCSFLSLKFWKSHLLNQDISRTKNLYKTCLSIQVWINFWDVPVLHISLACRCCISKSTFLRLIQFPLMYVISNLY